MRRTKSLTMIIGILMFILNIAGCGTFQNTLISPKKKLDSQKIERQKELQHKCDKADYVLSDLIKAVHQRVYSLKPGIVCHG